MSTATDTSKQIAWWREPTRDQWLAWWAAWLGWIRGMVKSAAGSMPLAYSSPEAVQTTGTVADLVGGRVMNFSLTAWPCCRLKSSAWDGFGIGRARLRDGSPGINHSRTRIGARIYPKAVGRDGITVESPIFCNFDAAAQRLPQPHNRHRNPGLGS
jgi:hypothetical protein